MNPKLVRRLFYPLQERILGRPTFRLLGELERSQWWSADTIRAFQARKLRTLLKKLSQCAPGYASCDVGRDRSDNDIFEALRGLPLLDKGAIRRLVTPVRNGLLTRGVTTMSTGGSTGEPLTFLVDPLRRAFDKAARMRSHRWFGVQPGDREAYLWGAPAGRWAQDRIRRWRDRLFNDMLISAFDMTPERMRDYWRRLVRFQPACLFGYPSSVTLLCQFTLEEGLRVDLPHLKAVFVTGEAFDARQRELIQGVLGATVADGYGGRDSGFCAHECPHGAMHVTSEHVILEVVDDSGNPLPPGESGEIVVTNLDNLATPFVRYRTGDVGRLRADLCGCGRGLPVMDVVAGRKTDHLVAENGSLRHALSLIYCLRDTRAVRQFQVRQRRDRSLDIHLVTEGALQEADRRQILDGVRSCVGSSLNTKLTVVDQIPLQRSGKFRHVISDAIR
jgi:phenylacetate-CoA ligase